MFKALKKKGYEVLFLHHAQAILRHDMPEAAGELEAAVQGVTLPVEELVRGGGGECQLTQRMRRSLAQMGWHRHSFEIKKIVDGQEKESISHQMDHVKRFDSGTVALEIEWNNKDPFFDRDLENFKRLHADGVISVGCIITRGLSLQSGLRGFIEQFASRQNINTLDSLRDYYLPTPRQRENIERAAARENSFAKGWAHAFVADKFGEATTHWRKLKDRVDRGVGNPCPLVLIGIPASIVTFEEGTCQ